ncbi:hypothetical protein BDN72DRAFT_782630, partial [Pluteus cervinus]
MCDYYLAVFQSDQTLPLEFVKPLTLDFPPEPLQQRLVDKVIRDFCKATSPEKIEEAGCAVCGELHQI